MPTPCLVKGCKNVTGRVKDVKFHRLPIKDMKNCREWLLRAGMTQKEISEVTFSRMKNWRICSAHFPSACRPGEPFLPTIGIPDYERRLAAEILLNMNNNATASSSTTTSGTSTESSQAGPTSDSGSQEGDQIYSTQSSNTGQSTSQMRNDNLINLPDCSVTAPEEVASTASSVRPKRKLFREMESQVTPKDPKKMRTKALQKTPPTSRQTEMTPKSKRSTFSNTDLTLSKDVQTPIPSQNFVVKKSTSTQTVIETENKSVQACLEKIEVLKSSDKELKKFTGIEDYKLFEILHKYLISKCSDSSCTIQTHSDDPSKLFSHISSENQLLLVLYKLKRNPVDSVLSSEFHISTGRISEIFKFWIKRMYRKFKIIKIWPSHENVHKHMPTATKQHFPDLFAISDCVEFSTQVPRAPLPGKQLFSNYKNCHTVKVMYSTAPNGALIHCSDAYGGNSSDKEIFAQSDLSTRLKPHDGLMVDKGFLIKDCIQGKDIKLYRPPFLTEKMKQFDTTDRESGRLIARSRIVVENFNARLSYFTFLKQKKIPVLYLPIMNEISYVCGFLANLGPLVRKTQSTETVDEQIEDEDML